MKKLFIIGSSLIIAVSFVMIMYEIITPESYSREVEVTERPIEERELNELLESLEEAVEEASGEIESEEQRNLDGQLERELEEALRKLEELENKPPVVEVVLMQPEQSFSKAILGWTGANLIGIISLVITLIKGRKKKSVHEVNA